uniref:HNH endonuclease family protein n=1 Tax=Escherichia coli TaxID=562 RepID=UPI001F036D42
FSHPVYLFLRKFSLQDSRGGSNLTLLNLSVNRSVQNAVFLKKRDALIVHTNLRLNIPLIVKDKWDEDEILERGKKLGEIALKVWPKHD